MTGASSRLASGEALTPSRIDLHTHSTASDGTLSPRDLMRAAADAGLGVIALTDHDTTLGWDEAAGALPPGLALVRGAELSCRQSTDDGLGISLHLLGYLFDAAHPALAAERRRVRDGRLDRGHRMVELLQAAGLDVSWPEVLAEAGGGTVGRPHIARALMRHGYVQDMDAAFGPDWLGTQGDYWVAKYETDAMAAIAMVRAAGGVPVIAHPRAGRRGRTLCDAHIAEFAAAGLAGLEVRHTDHSPVEQRELTALAADLGLLMTGSSDFHGANKSTPLGALLTDPVAYEALVGMATGCDVVTG